MQDWHPAAPHSMLSIEDMSLAAELFKAIPVRTGNFLLGLRAVGASVVVSVVSPPKEVL